PRNGVELIHREPAQRRVLQGLGIALAQPRQPHLEQGASVRQWDIGADALPHLDLYSELLPALPNESVHLRLAGLHLAAGKLPPPRRFRRISPLATEHTAIGDDGRADDDQLVRPFGVQAGKACQMSYRSRRPPCAKSVAMGDMRMWTNGQDEITLGSRA